MEGLPWDHGASTGLPWDFGAPVDSHEQTSMGFPWDFHGTLVLPWDSHGTPICVPLEASMGLPLCSHGTPTGMQWNFNGDYMRLWVP